MVSRNVRSVDINEIRSAPDLVRLAEEVRATGEPRVLRKDGEELAVVVSMSDFEAAAVPKSRRYWAEILALAGSWSDLDHDEMIAELDKIRHESPPSPPPDDVL